MLEKLYEEKSDVTGLTTGFRDLNKKNKWSSKIGFVTNSGTSCYG